MNTYIHIPFCKSKCKYCSFVSYPKLEMKDDYLKALRTEIKTFYKGETLETLYFGGGTPSLLSSKDLLQIVKLFRITNDTEITIELNPESISEIYLENLQKIGINRLSFGCQTFDDKILKYIGRRHKASDVINCVKSAQNIGFENINLDLIYGLPFQNTKMYDLNHAIDLGIKHISLYGLKIDKNCYFAKHPPKNLPDDDIQAQMYLNAIEILTRNGFEHYEISNFAKKGFSSKHNLNYWNNNTYYGFGAAAHGYINGIRYHNSNNLEEYITSNKRTEHKLSEQEILEEEIFLGFRKMNGINIENINKKFHIYFIKKYEKILSKYKEFFEKTEHGLKLNINGVLVSNVILSEFID